MSPLDPDHALRLAAIEHVRALSARHQELVPLPVLTRGVPFGGLALAERAATARSAC